MCDSQALLKSKYLITFAWKIPKRLIHNIMSNFLKFSRIILYTIMFPSVLKCSKVLGSVISGPWEKCYKASSSKNTSYMLNFLSKILAEIH